MGSEMCIRDSIFTDYLEVMKSREESVRVNTETTRKGFQYVVRVQILSIAVDESMIGEGAKIPVSIIKQSN